MNQVNLLPQRLQHLCKTTIVTFPGDATCGGWLDPHIGRSNFILYLTNIQPLDQWNPHHLHKNGRRHVWDWDLSPFLSRKSHFKGLTVYWPLKEDDRKCSANHPMSIFTDGHKSINIKSSFPDKHVHWRTGKEKFSIIGLVSSMGSGNIFFNQLYIRNTVGWNTVVGQNLGKARNG